VLFFDEPTIGVNPVGAREVRQLVAELAWSTAAFLLFTCFEREGRRSGTFDRL
jgi:ABC-type multidrug transport system ATPase subunit